jgi:hypothetical protein
MYNTFDSNISTQNTNPSYIPPYAVEHPDENSSLAFRLWYKAQQHKYRAVNDGSTDNEEYNKANRDFLLIMTLLMNSPTPVDCQIVWEMGNFYNQYREEEYTEEELENVKKWVIGLTRFDRLEYNKSIISLNITEGKHKYYFCIPLIKMLKHIALYALENAIPVKPILHARKVPIKQVFNKINNFPDAIIQSLESNNDLQAG